jgi:hypothetical protein
LISKQHNPRKKTHVTVIGSRKTDRKGRATGPIRTGKHGKVTWQFIPKPYAMMESPAYRVLSLAAHRILDRIEIEHGRHAGLENGRLIVTFQNFEDYGIERHAIGPGIRECTALGFIEVTQKGRAGNGDYRKPNAFRLTYLSVPPVGPTNDWSKIDTIEAAKAIKSMVRRAPSTRIRSVRRGDIDSSAETPTESRAAW